MTAFISSESSALELSALESEPTTSEQRYQAALKLAEVCAQILKKDFLADEVIIFGSLRGDTPWHSASDLDLAVRGLTKDQLLAAHNRLQKIVPEWLPFDLLAVERADERVRDRILQITPMPKNIFLETKIRLEDEIFMIAKTVKTLNDLLAQANSIPPIALTPATAGYIEDFYSGCERLAERVAVTLDGGLPEGKSWHQQLLTQVSKPGGRNRPPLWDQTLLSNLDQYRSFRHRVRHLYNIDLDDEKVLELARQIPSLFIQVKQSVNRFNLWLVEKAEKDLLG
ncbi:MAG: nucleotidyltransferase domain-containing protein [Cyanobacteria bacterium J06621_11]